MIQLSSWLFEKIMVRIHDRVSISGTEELNNGWKQVQKVILVKIRSAAAVISRPDYLLIEKIKPPLSLSSGGPDRSGTEETQNTTVSHKNQETSVQAAMQ
jgi:hypothetical protein